MWLLFHATRTGIAAELTAASGGNREQLLGQRPAGCEQSEAIMTERLRSSSKKKKKIPNPVKGFIIFCIIGSRRV